MTAFLDTSVIVRYLTGDYPNMAKQAASIIDGSDEVLVTQGVLQETAHVLTRLYGLSRSFVVDQLIDFVRKASVRPYGINKPILLEALLMCRPSGRVSFPDAILWAVARSSEVSVVYTFDQKFPTTNLDVIKLT
jgi:predicted nucleic acid-binding protein